MIDDTYQYCKVFVGEATPHAVSELLSEAFSDRFELSDAEVEVRRNPDAGLTEDFVGWPTIVEIGAAIEARAEAIVSITTTILRAVWDSGLPAVAACDYEAELRTHLQRH